MYISLFVNINLKPAVNLHYPIIIMLTKLLRYFNNVNYYIFFSSGCRLDWPMHEYIFKQSNKHAYVNE